MARKFVCVKTPLRLDGNNLAGKKKKKLKERRGMEKRLHAANDGGRDGKRKLARRGERRHAGMSGNTRRWRDTERKGFKQSDGTL